MAIGFWMNNKNCYGCKTCSIACKSEKQLDKGVLLRHVTAIRQDAPRAFAYLSMACNHCEEPACVANCPGRGLQQAGRRYGDSRSLRVHRLQDLHLGLPLRCAQLRRGVEHHVQVRRLL